MNLNTSTFFTQNTPGYIYAIYKKGKLMYLEKLGVANFDVGPTN